MLPGTKPPQTNTQSKFNTMPGKTRPRILQGTTGEHTQDVTRDRLRQAHIKANILTNL